MSSSKSIRLIRLLLILFISLPLSSGFAQKLLIKVIETSDIHGAIFPYDFRENRPMNSSMAQVTTYLKQERAKADQEVILLDNGDILQGEPSVYYYNFEKTTPPHLLSQVMNFMKYDAATIGNHDIETGHGVYDRMRSEFEFPWMAANAIEKKEGKPYFKPYTIIEKKGVKVAVLGLITPYIPNWLPEKIYAGMEFEDMIEAARKWVKIIKEKEQPDILIGLFHSGVEYTYNNQTAEMAGNENASQLVAERVSGFDLIFTGHDHKIWNKTVKSADSRDVLIMGPNNSARTVAVCNITIEKSADGVISGKELKGEIIDMKNFQPDKEFIDRFKPQFEEVKNYVSRKIGTFSRTISTRESMFGNSAFIDLINAIQLELTQADVSFTAPLSFDATIEKGDISVSDMFKLYKFENLLYTMTLTGKEIKNYLEYSYKNWFSQMKESTDNLMNYKRDEKGNILRSRGRNPELAAQYYNYDCAGGINYIVDVSKPAGERITIVSMSDGSKFDFEKKYKVALNSYRGNGGGGHLVQGAGIPKDELNSRMLNSTEKDLRYYMMKWIEKKGNVDPVATGNWSVIPREYWEKGKEKDYLLLYGNN